MPTPPTSGKVQPVAFGCITIPFLLLALIPLGWGARHQWAQGALSRNGERVQGRVTEVRYEPGNTSVSTRGRGSGESPVVAFTTQAGEARTMVGSTNRNPPPWSVGDSVEVVYDRDNPARADLVSETAWWPFWFAVWSLVGLVPFAIACAPIVLWLRERGSAE